MTPEKLKLRPQPIDVDSVDRIVRVLAEQRGIAPADAARELMRALCSWWGIDWPTEAKRAAGGEGGES